MDTWLKDSQPTNTKEAYGTYSDQFRSYAWAHGRDPYKASPNLISNFLRHLHVDKGLAATTINGAYCAVADLFRFRSKSPHKHHLVKETLRVLKRLAKNHKKEKQMIRPPVLKILLKNLDLDKVLQLRNAAMFVISYKAFLRSSECTSLEVGDVWIDFIDVEGVPTEVLFIFIQKSKTDQERRGHTIVLGADKAHPWKCPILFFKAYTRVRPEGAEAFFCTNEGKSISPKRVNAVLKQTCKKAGLKVSLYSSHGLRGGGATEAASKGINCRLIMRHGNWRSLAVYIYIHDDLSDRLSVSAAI